MNEFRGSGGAIEKSSPPPTGIAAVPAPGTRSPEEIRADIVHQRQELGSNVAALRTRVRDLTDIRKQVREHQTELIVGAAAIGTLAGAAIYLRTRGE